MRRGGQREKGKDAERKFARLLRGCLGPGVDVRRSSQAERAHQADVWTDGHEPLDKCWFEVTDGRSPRALDKLAQAERDVARLSPFQLPRYPVVIHHRLGERRTFATMRLSTFDVLRGNWSKETKLVTMELGEFLELVA